MKILILLLLGSLFCSVLPAYGSGPVPAIQVPRVTRPPRIEDFLEMRPSGDVAEMMGRAGDFIQREPSDGRPAGQRTDVFVGYDSENIYVVFVAFDSKPDEIRALPAQRDNALDDDYVELTLDTFRDQRRGYVFRCNPLGVQMDALWDESESESDFTFDAVWNSWGRKTSEGYVVLMAIPFKSLRFAASAGSQPWGVIFGRAIQRDNEKSYWPQSSSRVQGWLNQAGELQGLDQISAGRNAQVIPYGLFRSFRALDERDEWQPRFVKKAAQFEAGLDAKIVLRNRLVLDIALNPDFSQVESDEPQITTNQRFALYYPEKRPFFMENSGFFQTPIDLVLTRQIADPKYGVRLTTKSGPWSVGALLSDDLSPGRSVPDQDPLTGSRAYFGVLRVSRDVFSQSSVGLLYTDREYQGSYNRVGGLDASFKLNDNWTTRMQAVFSSTRNLDESRSRGHALEAGLNRDGRRFSYELSYSERSPDFVSLAGYIPRTDLREITQTASYSFRPESWLVSWGPGTYWRQAWDFEGTRLDLEAGPMLECELVGQTFGSLYYGLQRERLRPKDDYLLAQPVDFSYPHGEATFESQYFRHVSLKAEYDWGGAVNYEPPSGQAPFRARSRDLSLTAEIKPVPRLRIETTWLMQRLRDWGGKQSILGNDIFRLKWNWQFNRELSVRTILQYDSVRVNPMLTANETTRNFNADLLLTWQLNPWTALHLGTNHNLQNIDLLPVFGGTRVVRVPDHMIQDGRQFFVRFSYLLRF